MEGDNRREESLALLVIVVLAVLSLPSLIIAFSYYCYISNKVSKHLKSLSNKAKNEDKEKASRENSGVGGGGEVPVVVSKRGVQLFTYKQLHAATGRFGKANVVGHRSFGSVYRGVLPDGRKIAVKLLDRPGRQGEEEFEMEVELLTGDSSAVAAAALPWNDADLCGGGCGFLAPPTRCGTTSGSARFGSRAKKF